MNPIVVPSRVWKLGDMGAKKQHSDIDEELFSFFSGGYVGDLGLRSATGAQLDRLAFSMGPSVGHLPDGWNSNVNFGTTGPHGRLEASRVGRALAILCGPPPALDLPKETGKEERKRREAEYERLVHEWPSFFPALRGYYTRRPHNAYAGLLAFTDDSGNFTGVVLTMPKARALVEAWCAERLADDLEANRVAGVASHAERAERKAKKPPRKSTGAVDAGAMGAPDVEKAIRTRWATATEEHALGALRALGKRTSGPKDRPERQEARNAQAALLYAAKGLWRAARAAYQDVRRQVDREMRAEGKVRVRAEAVRFARSLEGPSVPEDQD